MILHIVKRGETLTGIAAAYGLSDWRRDIYDHAANSSFRARRPNPDLIYPGDEIMIPLEESPPQLVDRRLFSYKVEPITTVVGVQQRLNEAGFNAGPEDGIYGQQSESAVRRFQQFCKDNCNKGDPRITDSGPVDGIVGPATRRALQIYYTV